MNVKHIKSNDNTFDVLEIGAVFNCSSGLCLKISETKAFHLHENTINGMSHNPIAIPMHHELTVSANPIEEEEYNF